MIAGLSALSQHMIQVNVHVALTFHFDRDSECFLTPVQWYCDECYGVSIHVSGCCITFSFSSNGKRSSIITCAVNAFSVVLNGQI